MMDDGKSKTSARASDIRIVPGGKVYRQLFEAQIQVKEKYEEVIDKQQKNPPVIKITQDNIPLVKVQPLDLDGNELTKKSLETPRISVNKSLLDREEVAYLPDIVDPASKSSEIERKITESRYKRHQETWEDMVQEIGLLNNDIEQEIRSLSMIFLSNMDTSNRSIDSLLDELGDDNELIKNGSYAKFESIKARFLEHSTFRKGRIDQLDQELVALEKKRVEEIRAIIQKASEKLFTISYLPRSKLEKLLDDEIQTINGHVLRNKMIYAELYAKFISADMERERVQMFRINNKFKDWQNYSLNIQIDNIKNFIDNFNFYEQISTKFDDKQDLVTEIGVINAKRLELIESTKAFIPPNISKAIVYKWYDSITQENNKLEELLANYLNNINTAFQKTNSDIIQRIELTVEYLKANNITGKNDMNEILQSKFMPIWSEKQAQIEKFIDALEAHIERANKQVKQETIVLFEFLQSLSHIWDSHQMGLTKKERSLQELLQDCRRDHDTENQKREEKLDTILDQLREASTEKDLKRLMANVTLQLDAIKRGYINFKNAQNELLKCYPDMVSEELVAYEEKVLSFLSAGPEEKPAEENELDKDENSMRNILKEMSTTEPKTRFYITLDSNKIEKPGEEETKSQESGNLESFDSSVLPLNMNDIVLSSEIFESKRYFIRETFLNHINTWLEEAKRKCDAVVIAKLDEINKELDLRLHLHEPRAKRAEMDIHNVRAVELLMHEDRMNRHCAGIDEVIQDLQAQYKSLQDSLKLTSSQNKSDMLNLEILFNNANKSIRLMGLYDQLKKIKEQFMDDIKTKLRNFRANIDDTLTKLRNSNAKFRFSFNAFSDGGNFSNDEIESLKKRLEKMSVTIDSNETNMLKELEKLEKKHLDDAIKQTTQFQDKFKYHMVDLQFIEKISRWLNEAQVKIKCHVNESNKSAKVISKMVKDFDYQIDACERPNLDKMTVHPRDLIKFYQELNKKMIERADYLKCLKASEIKPEVEDRKRSVSTKATTTVTKTVKTTTVDESNPKSQQSKRTEISNSDMDSSETTTNQKAEDESLVIVKNIINNKKADLANTRDIEEIDTPSSRRKQSENASVDQKANIKKARTRDEMYSFYCTFGEFRSQGNDFLSIVSNILRESLEGILTNSEIFYKDLQLQNRQITHKASLKDNYSEFAEAIIKKLKSYYAQCERYLNQSLKEYRECLRNFEILSSKLPGLVFREIFENEKVKLTSQLKEIQAKHMSLQKLLASEKSENETMLKPSLGHPNKAAELDELNKKELARQEKQMRVIHEYMTELKRVMKLSCEEFLEYMTASNLELYENFDEMLTVDEVKMHESVAEKYSTKQLLRRNYYNIDLSGDANKPLIKRTKTSWRTVEGYEIVALGLTQGNDINQIVTTKTTLGHQSNEELSAYFHEEFKDLVVQSLSGFEKTHSENVIKYYKWAEYWKNSVEEIKKQF